MSTNIGDNMQGNTANAGESTGQAPASTPDDQGSQFQAIDSQDKLDAIIKDRLARERSKYQDYDKLKADAEEFRKLQDKDKTEAQREKDRADAAERRALELETRVLRAEVASEKGVPAALLTGTTKEDLEASADALLAFRGEQDKKKGPSSTSLNRVDNQQPVKGSTADQFAEFFEQRLK